MNTKELIEYIYKKILLPATLIFTILTVSFVAIMSGSSSDFTAYGMTMGAISQLLLFSFMLSGANRIFDIKGISPILKAFLHYIALCLTITVSFIWIGNRNMSIKAFVIIGVLYIIALGIYGIIHAIKGPAAKKEQDYKRQFK